jgi:hypothetical protein
LSANDKDDNETIPGPVHRFPGIYLTAEEILGKPQLGERLLKASPQDEIGMIAQHIRMGEEGKKERRGHSNCWSGEDFTVKNFRLI